MLKLLSDEWIAAEQENKAIRDAAREAFWKAVAGKRARDLDEIDIAPAERLGTITKLLDLAGNRLGDDDLLDIAKLAGSALSLIAPGTMPFSAQAQPLMISALTTEAHTSFFQNDVVPTSILTKRG